MSLSKKDLLKRKEMLIHQMYNIEGALMFIDKSLKEIEEAEEDGEKKSE